MLNIPTIEIPDEFYSSKTNKPIEECVLCGKKVLRDDEPYIIEKAFKNNEITKETELIFEYALCAECQQNTASELSEESLKSIKMYYDLYVDFEKRQAELKDTKDFKLSDWISHCIITGKPLKEYKEFQYGAMFFRDRLFLGNLPFAVGEKAMEEMQEILSKKTRDFLDGFKETIIPPGIRDKVPDDFLILM
jgi:hypothetical protein